MPTRDEDWRIAVKDAIQASLRKHENHEIRLNSHDTQLAVIQTKLVVYTAIASTAGSALVTVAMHFWK